MTAPKVSLIIVSWCRPHALIRCLQAVRQLWYRPLEIIVVADDTTIAQLQHASQAEHIKLIRVEEANISAARNLGIDAAGGDIVAFLDDDAAPEPSWLNYLIAPFSDPLVAIVGGFVKGRNGISWQWTGRTVDAEGHTHDLPTLSNEPLRIGQEQGNALKTEGTNMAVRAAVLRECGGFDPAYRYFLDETDLNLRLAASGFVAAVAPGAIVHHGFEPNASRRADRGPRNLFEIGASWAVFLAKHCPSERVASRWQEIRTSERKRLLRYMIDGRVDAWEIQKILRTLDAGYDSGSKRSVNHNLPKLKRLNHAFESLADPKSLQSEYIAGRPWAKGRLMDRCRAKVAAGKVATLMILSPTTLFHKVKFTEHGVWEHRGGLFGKSLRSDRLWQFWTFKKRAAREWSLVTARHKLANSP